MSDLMSKAQLFNALANVQTLADAYSVIQVMPTKDIVRCGSCRWNDGTAYCNFHYRNVTGEDFCSWGEEEQ